MESERTLLWVTPNPDDRRELVEATAGEVKLAVRFCVHGALFNLLRAAPCDLVGIELGERPDQTLTLVKELHERMPRVTILVASHDASLSVMRAALEAGASDFLSLPLNPPELHKALIKLTHQTTVRHAATHGVVGDVITMCGARGGLGVTTIAVNLAVRVAAFTNSKVALVDLDLQRGDVAAFLNLTPAQSLATIAAARGEVDELLLYSTLTRHPSGVFVLAAPLQMEEADSIGHDEVALALGLLRTRFRYTVIDTARMLTGATLAAFEQTDRIFVLTDLSVPGVRAARRTFDLLARLTTPVPRVDLLITQTAPSPIPLSDAVRTIGREPLLVIPRDEAAASHAMNAGAPLNGARPSPLAFAINELAAKLTGMPATSQVRRGRLLQRIFSKGART